MQKNCIRNKNVAWCECILQRIVYKGVEGGLCIMNHLLFFFLIWGARYILCVSAYRNGFTNTNHIYGVAAAASSADIATQQLVDTTDNATCAVRGVHRNQVYSYISVWIKIFNIINQNIYSSSLRLCCFASLFGVCVCVCVCVWSECMRSTQMRTAARASYFRWRCCNLCSNVTIVTVVRFVYLYLFIYTMRMNDDERCACIRAVDRERKYSLL